VLRIVDYPSVETVIDRCYLSRSPRPIREHVKFKVACLLRQSLSGQASLLGRWLPSRVRQLTFRLAWCREHSVVMATTLLQPRDLACRTLFQSRCVVQISPTECPDDSWRDTFLGKHKHGALWLLICGAIENHLLTGHFCHSSWISWHHRY